MYYDGICAYYENAKAFQVFKMIVFISCPYLNMLEHKRVIANLSQLHDCVHQGLGSSTALHQQAQLLHV